MKNLKNSFWKPTVVSLFAFLVIVLLSSPAPSAEAAWVGTGGPLGGLGYDVRISPANKNVMFVTDNFAGVIKSQNAGETWFASNSGITIKGGNTRDAINIFSLTIDPNNNNTIWAGTFGEGSEYGIFKSTDGGATWTLKNNGITLGSDIALAFRGFTIQPGNANVVYAQAEVPTTVQGWQFNRTKGRVYKTTDGGENWRLIWQGNNLARYLIIDPANANILYLSTGIFDREAYNSDCVNGSFGGEGVLKSIDGGNSWNAINNGLTDLYVGSLRMHPTNSQVLFAATGNNACSGWTTANILAGLYKTTNGGASWTKVIADDILTTVNFSPSNAAIIYAGSSFAFYRSGDGGSTWSKLFKPGATGYGPPGVKGGFPIDVVIDPDNPDILYVNSYGGGVFRSVDGAATWQDWSKGYSGADMQRVIIPPTDAASVYAIGRTGPFISSKHGDDWVGIANGSASVGNWEWYSIAPHPTNRNIMLMADQGQGVIFRSTDGGSNFTEVARHPDAVGADANKTQGFRTIAYAPSNPNIVYAGLARWLSFILDSPPIGTVIYKSTDAGATFSPLPSIIDGSSVNKLIVDPADANTVYAATMNGVYKSTNGAANWTFFSALGNKKIESLAINFQQPRHIVAGKAFGGILISQDDGASWTGPYSSGFSSSNPYITAIVVDPTNTSVLFASDWYSGIYKSTDQGFTWAPYPDASMSGLKVRAVKDLAVSDQIIFAATQGGGVFRYSRTSFYDVSLTNWAINHVEAIYAAGITRGCGNGNYCVTDNVTRGQMAAFIMRSLYGENFSYTTTPYFSDVPADHMFFKYVQMMKDTGVTKVSDTYLVDDTVTREQMAAFIIRAKYTESFIYTQTPPYFTDVPSADQFYAYIQKMKDTGITAVTGMYNPKANVTRDQMAVFLGRAFLGMQ